MAATTARPRGTSLYGQRIACSARDGCLGNSCTPYRRMGCPFGRVRRRKSTGVSVARLQGDLGSRKPVRKEFCQLRRYVRK